MTETVISSATRTVVIGFDRPFCIIGERINPTGRKKLAAEMAAGDFSTVERDTLAQVEAGAHMLDVNAGIPLADEPAILAKTIQLVQSLTDLPLSIDSSIVAALEAGLAVYKGRPLVNSVTGEEERLEAVLPLIKKYDCAVVAISNDETGISEDPDVRFEVAKKIVHHAQDYGIKPKDIVVDPLVMPIGALGNAGKSAFHLLRRLKEELKVNSTCGASNVSFGLPNRHGLNAAFLSMASLAGMTSAIMNPLHLEEMQGVMGADVMLGKDEHCRRWLTRFREAPAEGSAAAAAQVRAASGGGGARVRPDSGMPWTLRPPVCYWAEPASRPIRGRERHGPRRSLGRVVARRPHGLVPDEPSRGRTSRRGAPGAGAAGGALFLPGTTSAARGRGGLAAARAGSRLYDPWGLFRRVQADRALARRIGQALGGILAEQHGRIGPEDVAGWLPCRLPWPEPSDAAAGPAAARGGGCRAAACLERVLKRYEDQQERRRRATRARPRRPRSAQHRARHRTRTRWRACSTMTVRPGPTGTRIFAISCFLVPRTRRCWTELWKSTSPARPATRSRAHPPGQRSVRHRLSGISRRYVARGALCGRTLAEDLHGDPCLQGLGERCRSP